MLGRPIKEGKVALIPLTKEVHDQFPEWIKDEEVATHLGTYDHIPTQQDQDKHWEDTTSAEDQRVWQIEYENKPIGISSISHIDWLNRRAVTGTVIGDKSMWGQGIGTTTMILRARFAFQQLNLMSLETGVVESNIASARAMEKAGYEVVGTMPMRVFRDGTWLGMIIKVLTRDRFHEVHNH